MECCSNKTLAGLILLTGLLTNNVLAVSVELDQAIKTYYAGYPDQAIAMIRPLAIAGDVEAQYLLGNILYGLGNTGQSHDREDPTKWYRIAAQQGSAEANYALGVIYNNAWSKNQQKRDAELARTYYQKAKDLGYEKALVALARLAPQVDLTSKKQSLTYSNSSFSRKSASITKPADSYRQTAANNALRGFEPTDDLIADATKLKNLIEQISADDGTLALDSLLEDDSITRLLSGFESTEKLVSDLMNLMDTIKSATELEQ
ncbi:MAG: sel1 repeat family protein [Gammaproteobacteria bacterium]|nr:sel1 repeat family protein [Gammaproteobacteria bacterium]